VPFEKNSKSPVSTAFLQNPILQTADTRLRFSQIEKKSKKAKGKSKKAKVRKQIYFLPFTFCLLPCYFLP
jgi:hypothetical protein